jgi:hypothetical protein
LHEDGAAVHGTGHVDGSVRRDAGNAQARPLLERNAVGKRDRLLGRDHDVVGGRAERAIALRAETPHTLTDAGGGDPAAHRLDHSCSVTVGVVISPTTRTLAGGPCCSYQAAFMMPPMHPRGTRPNS